MSETIIKKGTANRWKGNDPVKGKLFLTKSRLLHNASALHFRRGETVMPLVEIESVEIDDNMLFKLPIPNALKVTMKDGTVHKFVVNRRKNWKKKIDEAMKQVTQDMVSE